MGRVAGAAPVTIETETVDGGGATGFWLRPGFPATFHRQLPVESRLTASAMSPAGGKLLVRWGALSENLRVGAKLLPVAARCRAVATQIMLEALDHPVFVAAPRVSYEGEPEASPLPPPVPPAVMVLVSCDTLRADALGAYGSPLPTPHLDRLARSGTLYENAYSSSPWTLPSHMTMLTGLYPGEHRVNPQRALPSSFPTLAERLRARGVEAAGFATKAGWMSGRFGFERGFSPYLLTWEAARPALERALLWLAEPSASPLFLFLHLYDAHSDTAARIYDAPSPYAGLLVAGEPAIERHHPATMGSAALLALNEALDHPSAARRRESGLRTEGRELQLVYLEGVLALDHDLGYLRRALARRDVGRLQLVVTADHGEEFLEHGRFLHDQLFDEVVRVPMITEGFDGPGLVTSPVELVDLAAAIEEAMVSKGPRPGPQGRARQFGFGPGPLRSIRSGHHKLLVELGRGPIALYDLEADPRESTDILSTEPEIAARLMKELDSRMKQSDRRFKEAVATGGGASLPAVELPDDERERLESLGYVDQ